MGTYGMPYMGSKDKICDKLVTIFPKAKNFYDVFGGGFSVTHAMLEHRFNDFKEFHFNEIRPGICELIQDAISGKYSYENFKPKWISREEFNKKKESDPYIKLCWSFGNNGKGYMFNPETEKYKKSIHNAVVFNEFDDFAEKFLGLKKFRESYSIKKRRLFFNSRARLLKKDRQLQQLQQLQQLEQLEQLQQLERLEQLEQLERLERLERLPINFTNLDYKDLKIKKDSVVYCDPPYIGTASYDGGFNHKEFYDWADGLKEPVFISEYTLDDNRFKEVFVAKKRSLLSSDKTKNIKREKVFANKTAWDLINGR
jgi:site-specific DNA-adenine methylase